MLGTHADTIAWLERQLKQLEVWHSDLVHEGACDPRRLEQIDLHRTWLKDQISSLTSSKLSPVA